MKKLKSRSGILAVFFCLCLLYPVSNIAAVRKPFTPAVVEKDVERFNGLLDKVNTNFKKAGTDAAGLADPSLSPASDKVAADVAAVTQDIASYSSVATYAEQSALKTKISPELRTAAADALAYTKIVKKIVSDQKKAAAVKAKETQKQEASNAKELLKQAAATKKASDATARELAKENAAAARTLRVSLQQQARASSTSAVKKPKTATVKAIKLSAVVFKAGKIVLKWSGGTPPILYLTRRTIRT